MLLRFANRSAGAEAMADMSGFAASEFQFALTVLLRLTASVKVGYLFADLSFDFSGRVCLSLGPRASATSRAGLLAGV